MNEYLNPSTLIPPVNNTWTQVTTTTAAKTVRVAGQTALDRDGTVVGAGDLRTQTVQALANVRLALEAAGARVEDLIRIRYYVVDWSMDEWPNLEAPILDFFDGTETPASTLLGVASLMYPELRIEIDADAAIRE